MIGLLSQATYSDTECALPGSRWCFVYKHGFQRRRWNFDRKFVHFKGYGAKPYYKFFQLQ